MTDNHGKGAKHVAEPIHRVINTFSLCGPLCSTLFLQLDNFTREKLNKYMMAYLESLVRRTVFDTIEVSILLVGNTHADINQ